MLGNVSAPRAAGVRRAGAEVAGFIEQGSTLTMHNDATAGAIAKNPDMTVPDIERLHVTFPRRIREMWQSSPTSSGCFYPGRSQT